MRRTSGLVAIGVIAIVLAALSVSLPPRVIFAGLGVIVVGSFTTLGYYSARRRNGPLFPMALMAAAAAVLTLGALANTRNGDAGATSWRTWLALGLALSAYVLGSVVGLSVIARLKAAVSSWAGSGQEVISPRQRQALRLLDAALLAIAVLNLATGEIIVLSTNLTSSRFSGSYGVAGRLWPIVLGALEALFALHVVLFARRRRPGDLIISAAIGAIFVATGSRSFLFIAFAAVAILYLERRRPSLSVVTAALATGILLAGSIGYLRVTSELGSGTLNQSLIDRNLPAGPLGQTLSNLSTGPWVLSTALDSTPSRIPFQQGQFFLRDGRNLMDSSVERSDRWVTQTVMERDVDANGGMPPTLIGGLYLDFGYLGIVVGLFAAAIATLWLYRVTSRRGLPGRLQYALWCAYLLTSLYSYLSLKPAFIASILALEVLVQIDRRSTASRGPHRVTGSNAP